VNNETGERNSEGGETKLNLVQAEGKSNWGEEVKDTIIGDDEL
jgi:hypothetical protein